MIQCSSHQDNKRLFGFVLQAVGGRGDSRAVCYIFESNNDGEKVACVCVGLLVSLSDTPIGLSDLFVSFFFFFTCFRSVTVSVWPSR